MPFNNYGYAAERLLPIQNSDSENIIRIWINNGTSVDRIITVSNDSIFNEQSLLVEIGITEKNKRNLINQKFQNPKSGIKPFLRKMDSLNLFQYDSQKEFSPALHQPISFYIIEQKKNGKYHQFEFRTYFPNENEEENEYTELEKLIMTEFEWKFYIK